MLGGNKGVLMNHWLNLMKKMSSSLRMMRMMMLLELIWAKVDILGVKGGLEETCWAEIG